MTEEYYTRSRHRRTRGEAGPQAVVDSEGEASGKKTL